MSGLIDSYRGVVHARECDNLGHMNVQFYVERLSQAYVAVITAVGLTPGYIRANRVGVAAVHMDISYRAELLAGDVIHMKSGLIKIENKKLHFHHSLYNSDTGQLVMTARVLGVCMSLDARKSIPLPDFVNANGQQLLVNPEDLP